MKFRGSSYSALGTEPSHFRYYASITLFNIEKSLTLISLGTLDQKNHMVYRLRGTFVIIDLRVPPSNRLEALKGARKRQHSIRINDQWRICFEWREDGVYEVEITDYHRGKL